MRNIAQVVGLLMILLVPASAATFDSYRIEYDAEKLIVKIEFTIQLENSSGIDISILKEPSNLEVKTDVPSTYSLQEKGNWIIGIDFPEPVSGPVDVTITFKSNFIEKLKDRNLFTFVFQSPGDIDNFELALLLPRGSVIYKVNGNPVFSPDAEIVTDGEKIIIEWNEPMGPDEEKVFLATFVKPKNQQLEFLILPVFVFALLFIVAVYAASRKRSERVVYKSLSEDEQIVYETIKKEPSITQDKVREISGFSKSKLSKVIHNLDKKGIVRKTPYKKTNKLEIKI